MKKLLLTIVLLLAFGLYTGVPVCAQKPVTVTVDGRVVNFDVQPRLIGGRTMVPLRAIFEELGATVEWDDKTQTVTAYNEVYIVKCTIDSNIMYINNEPKTIDVAPMVIDSRTLVPARFVAEAFNCNVDWNDSTFVVTITSNPIDYSNVEQNIGYTNSSAPSLNDTVYEPTTVIYYPSTNIPDYTYVTGIEKKRSPYYSDNGWVLYIYKDTKSGEFSEVVDYMGYLRENGWNLYDEEGDDSTLSWFYEKSQSYVGVTYDAEYEEIWIGVKTY